MTRTDACDYAEQIILDHSQVQAEPRDINVLKGTREAASWLGGDSNGLDCRTLDKLYDGINDTLDDSHMWLAPYTPGQYVEQGGGWGISVM